MLAFLLIIGLFLFRYSLGKNTVLGVILPSKSLKFEYYYPRFRVLLLIKKGLFRFKNTKILCVFSKRRGFFCLYSQKPHRISACSKPFRNIVNQSFGLLPSKAGVGD